MVRSRTDMTIVQEKDYITNTKASGYRSYHIIMPHIRSVRRWGRRRFSAEIQIRTNAMNFWATAEHPCGINTAATFRRSCRTDCITARRRRFIWIRKCLRFARKSRMHSG